MYEKVLKFWFEEIDSALWWKKDAFFDQLIIDKFTDIHQQAQYHAQCTDCIIPSIEYASNMHRDPFEQSHPV